MLFMELDVAQQASTVGAAKLKLLTYVMTDARCIMSYDLFEDRSGNYREGRLHLQVIQYPLNSPFDLTQPWTFMAIAVPAALHQVRKSSRHRGRNRRILPAVFRELYRPVVLVMIWNQASQDLFIITLAVNV